MRLPLSGASSHPSSGLCSYFGEADRFWRALFGAEKGKTTIVDVGANVGFYSLWPAADGHRRATTAAHFGIALRFVGFDFDSRIAPLAMQGLRVRATLCYGACTTSCRSKHLATTTHLGSTCNAHIPPSRSLVPNAIMHNRFPSRWMRLQAASGASDQLSVFEGGASDVEGFALVDVKWSPQEGFDTTVIAEPAALAGGADVGRLAANAAAAIRMPITTIDATVRAIDEVFFMKVVSAHNMHAGNVHQSSMQHAPSTNVLMKVVSAMQRSTCNSMQRTMYNNMQRTNVQHAAYNV